MVAAADDADCSTIALYRPNPAPSLDQEIAVAKATRTLASEIGPDGRCGAMDAP
jgi:hypothetical protein